LAQPITVIPESLIESEPTPQQLATLRAAESIGRPLGSEGFLDAIVCLMGARCETGEARAEEKQ
jgi:hypothetical protein